MKKATVQTVLSRVGVTLLTSALLGTCASAAAFTKTETFTPGMFADVPDTEWYAAEVQSTYELGLMKGNADGSFNPNGSVTLAEAITMASRAASIWSDESIDTSVSGEWYAPYVAYGIQKGFVTEGEYDHYDRPAKRYEVAKIFKKAMPDGYFAEKNDVSAVHDVDKSLPYAADILTLYKAGVVMGSDSYGTFLPENNITRAEAAAIINRVALPENRLSKTLDKKSTADAYVLSQNAIFTAPREGINSGWVLDNRGGLPKTAVDGEYAELTDVSETDGTALIREFNKITTGTIQFENTVKPSVFNGLSLEFRNENDEPVYKIYAKDDKWQILNPDGSYTAVMDKDGANPYVFRILIDIDNGRSTTYINKKNVGTYPLAKSGEHANILNFRYATDEKGTAASKFNAVKMTVNYAINQEFSWHADGTLPNEWTGENAIVPVGVGVIRITNGYANRTFTPESGIVIAETDVILTTGQNMTFALNSGDKKVVSFTSDDTAFYANGVKIYENYVKNLWYTIRLEAKTLEQKAVIYINGINRGEVDFAAATTSFDSLTVANASADSVDFDNILVFEKKIHEDYVPKPVKPAGEEKYTVGINICSLWRNGDHWGWSCISPYDDAEPVLGYYDEGVVETADWEIKYMVEHGIDFQAFCWFPDNKSAPLKDLRNAYQLNDAYKYAEYSDMMKYCLIWECQNAANPASVQDFKNYYAPYILEHYFKDPRYMTLENKPILAAFNPQKLVDAIGAAGVKESFDYLEEEAKKIGFDGVIFLSCNNYSNDLAAMGFDGAYAYNHGEKGYRIDVNTYNILQTAKNPDLYTVPTISVGFNSIAWHGTRYPMMTPEDFKTAQLWVRDEYLPTYAKKGTWQENFTMISTWNEYGEGTYIMPTAGNGGFGYLDALREVYTDEKADASVNTVPTETQKERINHLYPQYRKLLRRDGRYDFSIDESETDTVYTINFAENKGLHLNSCIKNAKFTEDGLTGYVDGDAFVLASVLDEVDTEKVSHVRITMDVKDDTHVYFYFLTNNDKTWSGDKSANFRTEGDGMNSYIIDMSAIDSWKDIIAQIRIDPDQTAVGAGSPETSSFTIKSIDFLSVHDRPSRKMHINGLEVESTLFFEEFNGNMLVPFDPALALDHRLDAFYTWNDAAKTLKLEANGHTVIFAVGSDKYIVDGEEKPLTFTMYETDGLPMVPMNLFCKAVGYEFDVNAKSEPVINTPQKPHFDAIAARKPGMWEFNTQGDTENFTSSNFTLSVKDGTMLATTTGTHRDPIINWNGKLNIKAERYPTLELRVRYKHDSEEPQCIVLYFSTDRDSSFREAHSLKAYLTSNDSKGEWETYTVDTTAVEGWKGNIEKLRLDPFNALGYMEFDYIRLIEDENYEEKPKEPDKFEIVGGDANSYTEAFYSNNAQLKVVADPDDPENNVYLLKPHDGKQWTYFRQNCAFTPGATYKIEFDVKIGGIGGDISGTNDAATTMIIGNMVYMSSDGKTTDHTVQPFVTVAPSDGWTHIELEYMIPEDATDRSKDQVSIFANPVSEQGVSYYVDNFFVTEILPE